MSCCSSKNKKPCPNQTCGLNNGLFIIVLYILLAIILSSVVFF